MEKKELLYEGKAKKIFSTESQDLVLMEYKNSLTAFNALKKGEFEGKGELNCQISTLIFEWLNRHQIHHHWIKNITTNSMLVQKTEIIPLEVVVRNRIAGSLAKKMGIEEGQKLETPLVEFYFKKDELNDPFLSDDQIIAFKISDQKTLEILKAEARKINLALIHLFKSVGIDLVDFKVEFGRNKTGQILLSDEISPDNMRLWDSLTNEKLDKDRFRRDLGNIKESYTLVLEKVKKGVQLEPESRH